MFGRHRGPARVSFILHREESLRWRPHRGKQHKIGLRFTKGEQNMNISVSAPAKDLSGLGSGEDRTLAKQTKQALEELLKLYI